MATLGQRVDPRHQVTVMEVVQRLARSGARPARLEAHADPERAHRSLAEAASSDAREGAGNRQHASTDRESH
jgi:hypothetical protein